MKIKLKYLELVFLVLFFCFLTNGLYASSINCPDNQTDLIDSTEILHKKLLAAEPPLGWNSYDSYRNNIGEEETL